MNGLAMALIIVIVPLALAKLKKSGDTATVPRNGKLWLEYGNAVKVFSFIAIMIPTALVSRYFLLMLTKYFQS